MPLRYYVPDWDDRVDPNYDFIHDVHTHGRDPYSNDYYAHQIYAPPPYDGVLVSRATIEANSRKHQAVLDAGSIHAYLRLPQDGSHTVLGDCGAFSYWEQHEPPYQTEAMVAYYKALGFDYGVSVDHLIFTSDPAERRRRQELTLHNAEAFLREWQALGKGFIPIGVAQGWGASSYRESAKQLIKMGYEYIAVGGLVRSKTEEVISILSAVQQVLQPNTELHLFGVNRPEYVSTFARLGVTSFDSASRLRRAWMDAHHNYYLGNEAYAAIRVREARGLAKKFSLDEVSTLQKEQELLRALRTYNKGEGDVDALLRQALDYAGLSGEMTARLKREYRQTLEARPWEQCPCTICTQIGIEVIIFRGNNRNRRRGFHNTWQLYQQLLALRNEPLDQMEVAMQTTITFDE